MKTELVSFLAFLSMAAAVVRADAVSNEVVRLDAVGPVTLRCAETGGWKLDFRKGKSADGVEELAVSLSSATEAVPPKFSLTFAVPQDGTHFLWHSAAESPVLPPAWHGGQTASLSKGMPLMVLMDEKDTSHLVFAASEAVLPVRTSAGLREADCCVIGGLHFFEEASAPMKAYSVRLRFDSRRIRWDEAVRSATAWMEQAGGYVPMAVPESARDPLYSTWYSFCQDISAAGIEDEARRAAALGMKTIIVDDGWQTDEKGRAYERCGDMTVSKIKFPDGMAAHVKRVQDAGLRYVLWVTTSMMGYRNAEYGRFKGKYLKQLPSVHCAILDPRFPEVREYLASMYERMMKEWGLDGFKFDYIGQFTLGSGDDGKPVKDPGLADDFAGRDTKSLAESVDWLMTDILRRLKAVKPDVLVEYRQPYLSPGIRRYGNMIRAIDCPGEMQKNLVRTAMLRLTSGETAVHSDMLEWNAGETPERAAKPILVSLFSTIQYSAKLSKLPEPHLKMMRHWIGFTQRHRETLLRGKFTACHPEAHYPLLRSESATEAVIGVYLAGYVAPVAGSKPSVIVNATGEAGVVIDAERPLEAAVYDTFGGQVSVCRVPAGFSWLAVPVSGYAELK